MITVVCEFLLFLDEEVEAGPDRLLRLASFLDDLAVAYHRSEPLEPDTEEADAPRQDWNRVISRIGKIFPTLGFYPYVDPSEGIEQAEVTQRWAADDLADIAGDLSDVLWYWEQGRQADAIWAFRFGYQSHWGRHLNGLRLYLHESFYGPHGSWPEAA